MHLSFNYTLQLISDISSDLQKLLRYFNGTATVAYFFRNSLLPSATVSSNNYALYLKDLKLLLLPVSVLKLIASSKPSTASHNKITRAVL